MTQFIPVDEYTTPLENSFTEETKLSEIKSFFSSTSIRHAPIVKDGEPIEIISDRDLYKALLEKNAADINAGSFMTKDVVTVRTGSGLTDAAFILSQKKIGSVLVVKADGKLDGIFTSTDALNALIEVLRDQV